MTYSIDMRQRAVAQVAEGKTRADVCRLFGIAPKTLYNWLCAKDLRSHPAKTRYRKIDREALRAHVRDNPDALLRERAEEFGVSIPAISYILKQMSIVKKNDALR